MNRAERDAVRLRYDFCCAYCGVSETEVGAELAVDHFHPQARGGADEASNWIYACFACNGFKGAYWPFNEEQLSLLNPLVDDFSLHLVEQNGEVIGVSPRGIHHIERLHLNRPALVARRRDVAQRRAAEEELRLALEELQRNREGREKREAEFERERT